MLLEFVCFSLCYSIRSICFFMISSLAFPNRIAIILVILLYLLTSCIDFVQIRKDRYRLLGTIWIKDLVIVQPRWAYTLMIPQGCNIIEAVAVGCIALKRVILSCVSALVVVIVLEAGPNQTHSILIIHFFFVILCRNLLAEALYTLIWPQGQRYVLLHNCASTVLRTNFTCKDNIPTALVLECTLQISYDEGRLCRVFAIPGLFLIELDFAHDVITANLELILVNSRHRKLRRLIQKSVTLPHYPGMLMQRVSWPMMLIMTFSDGIWAPVGEFGAS